MSWALSLRARAALALLASLLWTTQPIGAAQPERSEEVGGALGNVAGSVRSEAGDPVAKAKLELIDDQGVVVAQSETGSTGLFQMDCVEPGRYRLRLRPEAAGYRGETVVVPLDARGVRVDWKVAATVPALALATPTGGTCGGEGAPPAVAAGGAAAAEPAAPSDGADGTKAQFWARASSILAASVLVGGVAAGIASAGGGGGGGGGAPQSPSQ